MIPMYDGAQLTILDSYWKVTSAVTLCDEASVCKFIMVPVATQLKRRLEGTNYYMIILITSG